jgi:hypothetical protein
LSLLGRDSSVGIARATSRTAGVLFLAGKIGSSVLHSVQTGSGAHPHSYPMGTGVIILEVKRPGREDDRSPPSNAAVKNGGTIPPLLDTPLWLGA